MKITQERITPEQAQEYLKFNTENYRSISKDRVISYAGIWRTASGSSTAKRSSLTRTGN